MSDTYQIRSVADFLAVPQAKRGACLEQFALWLDIVEQSERLLVGIEGVNIGRDEYRWIDDGKCDVNVHMGVVNK